MSQLILFAILIPVLPLEPISFNVPWALACRAWETG